MLKILAESWINTNNSQNEMRANKKRKKFIESLFPQFTMPIKILSRFLVKDF